MWGLDVNERPGQHHNIPVWKRSKDKNRTEFRVLISGIRSIRFNSNTLYKYRVYFRLYSCEKVGDSDAIAIDILLVFFRTYETRARKLAWMDMAPAGNQREWKSLHACAIRLAGN
jgi:hypothetical protein